MITLATIIIYFYRFTTVSSNEEGSQCNSTAGWSGICTLSYECKTLVDILEKGQNPELCSNTEGPVVCCPKSIINSNLQHIQESIQYSPVLLGKQKKNQNIRADTVKEQSQYIIRKIPTYPRRRRRPCSKYSTSSHILLKAEDVDHVKIRTHLNKPKRTKRKPVPIRETFLLSDRRVQSDIQIIASPADIINNSNRTPSNTFGAPLHKSSLPSIKPSENESELQSSNPSRVTQMSSSPSQIMCEKYSANVSEIVAEFSKNGLIPFKSEKCSLIQVPVNGKTYQDRMVLPGQMPHVVGLGYKDNSEKIQWDECSGALISDSYVLTAAHCTHTTLGHPVVVSLGEITLGLSTSEVEIEVEEIITHPNYDSNTYNNDIALLKLSVPTQFNDRLRPACLHIDKHIPKSLIVAHWSTISAVTLQINISSNESHRFTDRDALRLQKTKMILGKNEECDIDPRINNSFICAHLVSSRRTLNCQGNGGDPLQVRHESNKCIYNLVGLSVENVCDESIPIAFTRISSFVKWIESIVWP